LQSALPFTAGRHRPEETGRPALPTDKVRFVGDRIACVVAETLAKPRASEAIEVDIEACRSYNAGQAARRRPGDLRGRRATCARFPLWRREKVNAAFGAAGSQGRSAPETR
jgi:carbon-monoxide dehydrogenase large subunit